MDPRFADRTLALTGGTGALGRRLVEALATAGAREVRVLTREPKAPARLGAVTHVRGDLRDGTGLAELLAGASGVFHLAAMKRVDDCEANPREAVRTNVIGSMNLVDAALANPGIEWVIGASSVSACAPVNVYGLTKSLMERLLHEADPPRGPAFAAVRLPSVWNTPGSVLDIWRRSVSETGAIPVTDPDMTRFAITPDEAIELLLAAATDPPRGGVVVPDAAAYRLADLAAEFAESRGASVRPVGARPGEKQHEDLISYEEAPFSRMSERGYVISPGTRQVGIRPVSSAHARRLDRTALRRLVRSDHVVA
jgi:FlaA1/EpsC-like NDP-sugar epimerase